MHVVGLLETFSLLKTFKKLKVLNPLVQKNRRFNLKSSFFVNILFVHY